MSGPSCALRARTLRPARRSKARARLACQRAVCDGWSKGMGRSYCEPSAHAVAVHVAARAARDDLAALHHEVLVGERARELVILLDEEDRHLAGRGERPDRALDVLDDGRLDAFRRLVEDEELRLHRERSPDGELLLLAAREVAAAPAPHLPQDRKELEHTRRP